MTRSDRFRPIKEIADSRERDAGSIVARAQAALLEREQKLHELRRYREEYTGSLGAGRAQTGAIDALRLQNYRAFLARLEEAIRQQELAVTVAREDYERKREAWVTRRGEAGAIGNAMERLRREEARVEAQREQQRTDEQAAALRRNRELAGDTGTWRIGSTGRYTKLKDEGEH